MIVRRIYSTKESVLAGIRDSDDKVLEFLYKEHYPMIKNLVMTNSGRDEDAKDILQEGIIALYEKVKNRDFILTCEVKTFIYSVCRNLWLKSLRKNCNTVKFEEVHNEIIETEVINEEEMSQKQRILADLINKIGENCKEILTLFYYEKLSMEDIALKLGYTNADNAKTQKYKCFKKLQLGTVSQFNTLKR
jgi:RNA polymerase sigma factor (sigma-70 family)